MQTANMTGKEKCGVNSTGNYAGQPYKL